MAKFDDINKVGRDLFMLGLVEGSGGSISVRMDNRITITKKGAMLGYLREDDLIELSLDEQSAEDEKASKELPVHRAIYKETPFKAIISASPSTAIALSMTSENKINPLDQKSQAVIRSIPVVRLRDRGNLDEAVKMLPSIYKSGYFVSLIREYGTFAVGEDLYEAMAYTSSAEQASKVIVANKIMTPEIRKSEPHHVSRERRSAIPPSIGVMDRSSRGGGFKRGFGR